MISALAEGWTHAISVWDEWVNPNAAFSKSLYLEKKKKKKREVVMTTLVLMNPTPSSTIDNTLIKWLQWNLFSAID